MSEKTLTVLQIDDKTITSDLDRAGYRKMGVTIKNATSFQSASDILEGGKDTIDIIVINVTLRRQERPNDGNVREALFSGH